MIRRFLGCLGQILFFIVAMSMIVNYFNGNLRFGGISQNDYVTEQQANQLVKNHPEQLLHRVVKVDVDNVKSSNQIVTKKGLICNGKIPHNTGDGSQLYVYVKEASADGNSISGSLTPHLRPDMRWRQKFYQNDFHFGQKIQEMFSGLGVLF